MSTDREKVLWVVHHALVVGLLYIGIPVAFVTSLWIAGLVATR